MDLFTLLSFLRDSLSLSTTSVRLGVSFSCRSLETNPRRVSSAVAGSTTNNDRAPSILNAVQLRVPSTLEQIDSYIADPAAKDRIHTSLHIVFSFVLFSHLFPAAVLTYLFVFRGGNDPSGGALVTGVDTANDIAKGVHKLREAGSSVASRPLSLASFCHCFENSIFPSSSLHQVPTIFSFSRSKVSFPVSDPSFVPLRLFLVVLCSLFGSSDD